MEIPEFLKSERLRRRFLLICVFALIVLMGLVVAGRFLLKPRSHKLMEEATELANHGDWQGASEKSAAAANLDKKNNAMLRLAILTAMRTGNPALPGLSDRLFQQGVSAHDRYLALKSDAAAMQWEAFDRKVQTLSAEERKGEAIAELEAIGLSQRKRTAEAIDLARRAYKEGGSRKMAYILANLLMQAKPRPDAEIAALLAQVAQPEAGMDALAALPLIQDLSPKAIRASKIRLGLPDMVKKLQKATTPDFLAALEIERKRSPEKLDMLVEQAVDWNESHPSPEIFRWLIARGKMDKTRKAYNDSPLAQQSADYDDIRIALAINKKYYLSARQILEASAGYDTPQKNILLATIASASGMEDEPQLWENAFADAKKDTTGEQALQIARSARSVKRDTIRHQALLLAMATPARENFSRLEALEVVEGLMKKSDTKGAFIFAKSFLQSHPNDLIFENNALYFELLVNGDAPGAVEKLEKLRKLYPNQAGFRSTLALAYLRQSKPQQAVDLLSRTANLSNASLAVDAAALHAVGRDEEARGILRKINRSKLLPEEDALLKGL
ncbi:MAG: hypothetical protein ABI615_02635 [Chthoniobacterales bacterium]